MLLPLPITMTAGDRNHRQYKLHLCTEYDGQVNFVDVTNAVATTANHPPVVALAALTLCCEFGLCCRRLAGLSQATGDRRR